LIIFASQKKRHSHKNINSLAQVFFLKEKQGKLSVRNILKILYSLKIRSVFVEGGAETVGRFFDEELVDKIYLFIAPKIIGGEGSLSAIKGKGFPYLNNCPVIKDICVKHIGEDLLICGYPDYGKN
jgi:diaminohydroxyphosphoribosylaminopyrimidine deaminase/5-amino-6-(5-phosphoribosylamino)uracil reductase